jgi:hypothetical protein
MKRSERKADHSLRSSAEVKNEWRYTATPLISHGGVLGDKFTLLTLLLIRYKKFLPVSK